jgi:hypothetical protein
MGMRKTISLALFAISVFLGGCAALDLRQANHELADLYRAKSEALNSGHWEQEVTVNAALSALADAAAAQGADTSSSQVNRISFYRIAATAAWQAGDPKVVAYANEGFSLCTPENYPKAPRDCGMLSVIPGFASVDELTKRMEGIRRRGSGGPNPPAEQEVVQLFEDIRSRIDSLLRNRNTIRQSSAHPRLAEEIDKQAGTILCIHLLNAGGLIVQIAGDGSAMHRKAQCDEYKLEVEMKKMGFSQSVAPCLPSGAPTRPEGCE